MTAPGPRVALPGTDLAVSPLCLGGNRFGGEFDEGACFALDAVAERGGNFVDTAHGGPPRSPRQRAGPWDRVGAPASDNLA